MEYPYGHFNQSGDEFVVTDPATPRAFDNFLWNDAVFSNVQQTGVGYCDYQIGENEAVQLMTGNGRVCDFDIFGRDTLMSRLVYIRDNDTGVYWNVGWEPICAPYDRFACRHGLGYTVIESSTGGVAGSLRIFVPTGKDPIELWTLRLVNESGRRRNLSVFVYNQIQFRYKWGFDSYGDMLFRSAGFRAEDNAVVVSKHPHIKPHDFLTAYLTADKPAAAYDGTRSAFVGQYNTLKNPQAVERGRLSNTPGSSDATIAALQFDLTLEAESAETLNLILGVVDSEDKIAGYREKYFGRFEDCFEALRAQNRRLADTYRVKTPDAHLDRMLNYWIKAQCMFGARWCRWGWNGYRDTVQHGFGVSALDPARTREILLEATRYQYFSGLALRGWNPVDTKPYSDSALWLVFTLIAYLKETADVSILHETVPYYDEGQDSLLAHIEQALQFLCDHKGAHGLCLIKFGDWNDSLTAVGREGRGESVWLSQAYCEASRQMAGLYAFLGDREKEQMHLQRYAQMKQAVNDAAWDGAWYVRCFDDGGRPVGSDACKEGKIFSESQGWSLIADIAPPERAAKVIASCDALLGTSQGYRLLAPTFTAVDDRIGRISCMEPGICENGTIYSHINIWIILGLLRQGQADKAYEAFRTLSAGYPGGERKGDNPPYIYANCYYGPDHKNAAMLMEFTWITGSIAWINHVLLDEMLGVRPDYEGLEISPCCPAAFTSYQVTRRFRGATYDIHVENPTGAAGKSCKITVDGRPVEGRRLPVFEDDAVHRVDVEILA